MKLKNIKKNNGRSMETDKAQRIPKTARRT